MGLPRITPWSTRDELEDLKKWFYPDKMGESRMIGEIDSRCRAIQRVKSYQSKGSQYLPHVIDSTAQITSSILLDEQTTNASLDNFPTRLSYTMSLVRFVNGLLDPTQQSQYAIPLHTLAQNIGLPSLFVDLRHGGTHERELPSLDMLRYVSSEALLWLWNHYWNDDELDDSDDEPASDLDCDMIKNLQKMLRNGQVLKDLLTEYRWAWENDTNLISSSNFMVEEPSSRVHRRDVDMPPKERIDSFVSSCKELWKQCPDKNVFIEVFITYYQPILLQVFVTKLKGFDQLFYSWIAKSFKDQLEGTTGTLRKMFQNWSLLERDLLRIFTESLNLRIVVSQLDSWKTAFDKSASYLTLWLCFALSKKIDEFKCSHSHKRRKKKKQSDFTQELEGLLREKIAKLSKLYNDSEKRMYNISGWAKLAASSDNLLNQTDGILNDLASLKQRMNRTRVTKVAKVAKVDNIATTNHHPEVKIWSKLEVWKPRPFGTL